jgi:hypothetical protein
MGLPDPEEALRQLDRLASQESTADDVPPVTTITINVKDKRGRTYEGTFYYAVPTLEDQLRMGQLKTLYLGAMGTPDLGAQSIANVITYLTICIHFDDKNKKPSWWNPLKAFDLLPYSTLYSRCLEYEARFHGEGSNDRDLQNDAQESNASRAEHPPSVGRKISPSAERSEALTGHDS